MTEHRYRTQKNFAVLALAVHLVIIYGSLFPFHFIERPGGPLVSLMSTWNQFSGRGDLIANVLLYLPLGFFAAGALLTRPALVRIAAVTAAGLSLSLGLELAQFYDVSRQSAMSDLYANTTGAFFGAIASHFYEGEVYFGKSKLCQRPFIILLLASWFGYRLFPYVPVIDLHKYWSAVRPVFTNNGIPLIDCYRHLAAWLAIAVLLEELTGAIRKRLAVWAAFAVVILGRIFVVGIVLTRAEIAGGLLAALLWSTLLADWPSRVRITAVVFAAATVLQGLEPFRFSTGRHALVWVPFQGFLRGSIELNVLSCFEKVFVYGVLVWLTMRAGKRWSLATLLGCALVFAVRLAQTYLPDRSADMTDVTLLLLVSGCAKLLGETRNGARTTNSTPVGSTQSGLWRRIRGTLTVQNSVQPADLILVLAGRVDRKAYGLQLHRAGIAPRLALSVGRFEVSKIRHLIGDGYEELLAMRDATPAKERHFVFLMGSSGTHVENIRLPRWSTYGEALGLRTFLEKQDVRRVIVVSTDIHLARAELSFRKAFQGSPMEFLYCPVPACLESPRPGLGYVFQECFKLAGYRAILALPPPLANVLMRLR